MSPTLRKLTLVAHIVSSVGWLGSVAVFLALAVAGITASDSEAARAPYAVMGLITWWVILPLCVTSLLTGIGLSLGTTWGLFKHYWILIKVLMTVPATVLLMVHMHPISEISAIAHRATFSLTDLGGLRTQMVANAAMALVILGIATILSVYKPQGRTGFGATVVP